MKKIIFITSFIVACSGGGNSIISSISTSTSSLIDYDQVSATMVPFL